MLVACSLGQRFGLVSLEASQRAQHEELARAYGLRERLAGVVAMHPPIDEYSLEGGEETVPPTARRLRRGLRRLVEMGAEVVIPGDGFLNEFVWRHGPAGEPRRRGDGCAGHAVPLRRFMAGARPRSGFRSAAPASTPGRRPRCWRRRGRRPAPVTWRKGMFSGGDDRR